MFPCLISKTPSSADQRHPYVTTPVSLRGTWYQYDQAGHYFMKMTITKYTWSVDYAPHYATTVSSKRIIPHTSMTQLACPQLKSHGYWQLKQNHTEYSMLLKRGSIKINRQKITVLKNYYPNAPQAVSVWTTRKIR
ncbi:hypothetical protein FD41_GL001007 [Lentilactobacillus farraginis DSM 18382 = JCM 14108]|uniref:Uncharacterized protein n=2 Tax=Lentilactobacillus farraginis TaxID=390841 RepID=A0A0R1VFC2_9LACO|nr:hypothetical protein FD41_GL001007 [Lentilactobacillus farraginis DSM 18382 = JCM 14108]